MNLETACIVTHWKEYLGTSIFAESPIDLKLQLTDLIIDDTKTDKDEETYLTMMIHIFLDKVNWDLIFAEHCLRGDKNA